MATTAPATFDLERLARAIAARDAAGQIDQYALDATVTIVDRISQPGAPKLLRGRGQIAGWIEDTCSREMTHTVTHKVADENGAGFVLECRYPDGTNVICATLLSLSDGLISSQTVVQAWDEEASR